jgi:hypothetical protein
VRRLHLARIEFAEVITAVLTRLPDFQIETAVVEYPNWSVSRLGELPATFTRGEGASMHDLVISGGRSSTAPAARRARPTSRARRHRRGGRARRRPCEPHRRRRRSARDPGFVDVHTHFDGQATWIPTSPRRAGGVTTTVLGNCGVGAPVRPGREQWLIELMEGVEDIPGTAGRGHPWN